MPLYVFACDICGNSTEKLQKFDDPWPDCAECACKMSKKPAKTSFSLKGSGWAKDNYGLKGDN
jgi:putative FmdB family regulatory protein